MADVTLSLIQQHWSLINSSTPLGLIVNVACKAYLAAQSITAETNLINNANIVGENVNLIELIYYFEKKNLFLGGFGTWPKNIKELFDDLNIKYDFSTDPNDLPKYTPSKYKGCITTYFNKYWQQGVSTKKDIKRLTIHTTFWPTINKYYCIYNDSQQCLTKASNEVLEVNGDESSSKSKIEDEIKINPENDKKKFISIFGLNN